LEQLWYRSGRIGNGGDGVEKNVLLLCKIK
jgi:hypothetical protein